MVVSLRWVVEGGEARSMRAQQARHLDQGPLSPIPNGRTGSLKGARLLRQHEREENRGFILKIPASTIH